MALEGVANGYGGYAGYYYENGKKTNNEEAGKVLPDNLKPEENPLEQEKEKPLSEMDRQDMIDYIRQRAQVIMEKVLKGDTETKIQIGGAEYSEEEWDKILRRVDEAIQNMKEETQEEKEKREEIQDGEKQSKLDVAEELMEEINRDRGQGDVLRTEMTEEEMAAARLESALESMDANERRVKEIQKITDVINLAMQTEAEEAMKTEQKTEPVENKGDNCSKVRALGVFRDGTETQVVSETEQQSDKKIMYVTHVSSTGITCRSSEQRIGDPPLWEIAFNGPEDYHRVTQFLRRFSEDCNLNFASSETFWNDFLAGRIEEDEFYDFYQNKEQELLKFFGQADGESMINQDNFHYVKYALDKMPAYTSFEGLKERPAGQNAVQKDLTEQDEDWRTDRLEAYYEELFRYTPAGVRAAWEAARQETGVDGLGMDEEGKLTHITQIMVERLLGSHEDYSTILGKTIESAYAFANDAIEGLEYELFRSGSVLKNRGNKEQELEFYKAFIKHLSAGLQDIE